MSTQFSFFKSMIKVIAHLMSQSVPQLQREMLRRREDTSNASLAQTLQGRYATSRSTRVPHSSTGRASRSASSLLASIPRTGNPIPSDCTRSPPRATATSSTATRYHCACGAPCTGTRIWVRRIRQRRACAPTSSAIPNLEVR